jgi:cardiolipin synthase
VLRLLPNALTLLRLASAPLLAWLLISSRFAEALALVLVAGLTDWFDGWTARRLGVGGKLGVILDPLADKTLLVTLFIFLGAVGLIPFWLVLLVLGRDVTIVIGALLLRLFRQVRRFLPSTLGKVSTFFQIVLVLLVLLEATLPWWVLSFLERIALVLSASFTALSGLDYIRRGIQMASRRVVA